MISRVFKFLAAVSFLLCVATIVLWVRAGQVKTDYLTVPIPSGRVVARCDATAVTLVGPPPPGPAAGEAAVRRLTAVMRNGDLAFGCSTRPNDKLALDIASYQVTTRDGLPLAGRVRDFTPNTPNGTVSLEAMQGEGLPPIRFDSYRRPLLEALNDPNRFAAVHHLLYKMDRRIRRLPIPMYGRLTREGDCYVLDQEGLRVEFPIPDDNTEHRDATGAPGVHIWTYYLDKPRQVRIDPAQMPRIRDYWQMTLGQPLGSVPYWVVLALGAMLPGVWFGQWLKRARRSPGTCRACGYDLRATRDRCPECGAAPAEKGATT
jgi:hypothetical protein